MKTKGEPNKAKAKGEPSKAKAKSSSKVNRLDTEEDKEQEPAPSVRKLEHRSYFSHLLTTDALFFSISLYISPQRTAQ